MLQRHTNGLKNTDLLSDHQGTIMSAARKWNGLSVHAFTGPDQVDIGDQMP